MFKKLAAFAAVILSFAAMASTAQAVPDKTHGGSWQVTAGHCEGHARIGEMWTYGGHTYGCWQYGWEIRTYLWVP